jgi:hypothetical protein
MTELSASALLPLLAINEAWLVSLHQNRFRLYYIGSEVDKGARNQSGPFGMLY